MKRTTKYAAIAAALGIGLAAATALQAQGPGYGYGPCGTGQAWGQGYGQQAPTGPGYGPCWNQPGMGSGMMGPGYGGRGMRGPGMMGPGYGRGMAGPRGGMGAMGLTPDQAQARLDYVKSQLQIGPEQEAAWERYAAVVREQAAEQQSFFENRIQRMQAARAMPLEEHIKFRDEMMRSRFESRDKTDRAARELYGELTPEQRQTADWLLGGRW